VFAIFSNTSTIHNEFVCVALGVYSSKKYFPFLFGDNGLLMYKEVDENTSSRKTLFATNITNLGVHATLMNNVVYPKSLLVRK
jgi:hypothetical protein